MVPPSRSDPSSGEQQWHLRSYVLHRRDFNEMRMRLPRAVRRDVEAVPEGHVGLVAQAVVGAGGDTPLAVLYDNAPAPVAEQRLQELRRRLTDLLR